MKLLLCCSLSIFCFIFATGFRKAQYTSGEDVVRKMKEIHATSSEIELIKMVVIDESGNTQIRELISVIKPDTDGNLRYIIRFLSPEDIRGVTLLTLEKLRDDSEQYLFLPALGIPRKISGSQKSGYFMGSDFTFEDLRKENADEHTYQRLMDDTVKGREVYKIRSAPKLVQVHTASGYANRILYVDKETFEILKIEFYEEGKTEPTKTFQGHDYRSPDIDGNSKRPHRAVMNHHENNTTSILTVLKSRLNVEIDESIFNPEQLKTWKPETDQALLAYFTRPAKD